MEVVVQARAKNGLLYRAVKKCGSAKALADYLGVCQTSVGKWLNFKDIPAFRSTERKFYLRDKPLYDRLDERLIALIGYGLEEIFPVELDTHKEVLRKLAFQEKVVEMPVEWLLQSGAVQQLPPSPWENMVELDLKDQINAVLGDLEPRYQEVVKRRFGLDGHDPQSLEEVSQVLHVTRERIRQMEARALRKLRHPDRARRLKDLYYQTPAPING